MRGNMSTDGTINSTESDTEMYKEVTTEFSTFEWTAVLESTTDLENLVLNVSGIITEPWFYYAACVIVPILLVLGLFGNISVIIIMARRSFRTTTTAVFVIALALSDTKFILLFPFTKSFTNDLFGYDVKALSVIGCKAFFCMYRTSKIFSSWIVVLICIERFIVIWFPLQAKRILTRQTAIVTVLVLLIVVYIFDGIWSLTTGIMNGICIPIVLTPENIEFSTFFVVAGTLIYNVLPSAFLVCLTPLTIIKLLRHRSKRMKMTGSNVTRIDETYRINRMLVAVTIAYLILVTPMSVAHSVAFFTGDNIFQSTDENLVIFREIAQIGEQMNYIVNFFIYVIFNSTFRQNFLMMICRHTAVLSCRKADRVVESRSSGDPQCSNSISDITNSLSN